MTANAMAADRDRCLAAGMNDHIAKPIEPRELFDKLLHWVRPADAAATAATTTPADATPEGRSEPSPTVDNS